MKPLVSEMLGILSSPLTSTRYRTLAMGSASKTARIRNGMMFRPRTAKDWPTTPPMEILSDLPADL